MLDDDGKLKQKFSNKRVNASKEGIEFKLSFEDILTILKESNITSSSWGRSGGYDLARYGDKGPYEYGNCRFITLAENMKERGYKEPTELQKISSSNSIKIARKALTKEALKEAGKKGAEVSNKANREQSLAKREGIVRKVIENGIDVSSYGWKAKAAKLCGVSSTEIRRAFELCYEGVTYKR